MSLIGLLLGRMKLPQWALELIAIGAIAGGFWWYHHHVYAQGIAAQKASDAKASAGAIAEAHAQTQANQAAADAGHYAWIREHSDENAAVARVPLPTVSMCLDAYAGDTGVPGAGAPDTGNAGAGAGAGGVPQVPAGDPRLRAGRGPDISGLLDLLARRGDAVSAELREFQSRELAARSQPTETTP